MLAYRGRMGGYLRPKHHHAMHLAEQVALLDGQMLAAMVCERKHKLFKVVGQNIKASGPYAERVTKRLLGDLVASAQDGDRYRVGEFIVDEKFVQDVGLVVGARANFYGMPVSQGDIIYYNDAGVFGVGEVCNFRRRVAEEIVHVEICVFSAEGPANHNEWRPIEQRKVVLLSDVYGACIWRHGPDGNYVVLRPSSIEWAFA